jgi:hypothetical protein
LSDDKKPFKALLLDERDVLRAVVELADESELTERHVDLRPHGGECDRKPGEYRWDREQKTLRPLSRTARAVQGRPSSDQAMAFDYLLRWKADQASVPEVCLAWLDDVLDSVDLKAYVVARHPDIVAYDAARAEPLQEGSLSP